MLLKELNVDYGPTSFKLFSSCMESDGFDEMVKQACVDFDATPRDNKCVTMKMKLKFLKSRIRE